MAQEMEALFVELVRRYINEFRQQIDKEVTAAQFHLLETLFEQGATKMTDLSEVLRVTVGAVTLQADRLIKANLIERGRSETNRRVVLLTITDEGRELMEQVRKIRHGVLEDFFGKLTEEDQRQLERIFRKVLEE